MPLGERIGEDSDSRYCGVEAEFNDDVPQLMAFNLSSGGFDFVVAPLCNCIISFIQRASITATSASRCIKVF